MPGNPPPIDVLLIDDVEPGKAAWRADERIGHRRTVADAQEVRDTDFTGQFAGLYVRSLEGTFRLDTGDVQADDGVSVIIDAAGNHFLRDTTGAGDVTASVVFGADNRLIRSDGASKGVQSSGVTLSDAGAMSGVTLTAPVINSPTGIVKGDVGLGNVDNTSDANKPVSTATQTALDLKLNSSGYTAADVLSKLLTVDGPGSGVDADTLDGNSSAFFATATGLSDHLADTGDAHDASAISYAGGTGMSATDVEAAIDELATEKLNATSYTAADVLAKLVTVDGPGSGLDADTLDGSSSAAFQAAGATLASLEALSLVSGDIIYATAADTLARLPKGADGQFLRLAAGLPDWEAIAGGGDMLAANNGSDFSSPKTAFDNINIHGADVASAGTIDLDAATGVLIDVTGTTTITAITLANGRERVVRLTGALTLTNGASLVLPGGQNIVTAAGDYAIFRGYAAGVVRCVVFIRKDGHPLNTLIATVASAGTTDLGSNIASTITVSGTTTITAFGSTAPTGAIKRVKFSGILILTHNATSLILPGAANITTAAGDSLEALHEGSGNWRVIQFTVAASAPGGGSSAIGKHTIWIPASAMWARTTAGPGAASRELTTGGDIMVKGWAFDTTTEEAVQFYIGFPKSWNESTITFQAFWTNASGLATETVFWALSAGAFTDSDAMDTTDLGTAVQVSDTWLAANDMHVSAESSAVTVGNTPIDGDMVIGQIARSVADDNMTGDADLLGIKIFYDIDAATDA